MTEPLRAALERIEADAGWLHDHVPDYSPDGVATLRDVAREIAKEAFLARAALAVPDGAVDPVYETANERDAITQDRVWASGYAAGRAAATSAFLKGAQGQQEALDALAADRGAVDLDAVVRELFDQWWSNHAEHCSNVEWPHPEGHRCMWPQPASLRAVRLQAPPEPQE